MNRIGLTLCVFLALYYEANSAGYQPSAEDAPAPGENPDKPSPPPPYALSYVYVKHLAKIEEELYQIMQNYEAALKLRLKIVSNYVKDYEDSTLKGTKHLDSHPDPMAKAAAVASHPLMAYRLIKRYASEIDALGNNLAKNPESHIKKRVSEMMDGRPWPTKSDNEAAMDGLLRMHYVYNFDLKEFTSGKIGDIQTNVGLTAKQTFHIAKFATYASFHTQAMDWLKVTSWKVLNKTDEGSNDIGVNTIALAYKNAVDKHNQEIESTNNTGNLYTYTSKILGNDLPPKKRDATLEMFKDAEKLDWEEIEQMDESEAAERSHFDYISLCNGKGTQTEAEKAELYCYYERKKNPYWYFNPLKTEILNLDPPLIQMYDFIGDKWIDYLIKKATPISRAPPPSDGTATPRSAAYAWLNDSDIPETPLSRRIELITGLNVRGEEASTALQIASYIFGGHVANHVDSLGEDADDRGDRVTTFLIYMNDVPAGGYTAYPVLGTFVRPIKGSAILWYDSLKNGDIDNRMLHGACPPIFGHKWIATKWTHLNENMFTRPCDLDPEV